MAGEFVARGKGIAACKPSDLSPNPLCMITAHEQGSDSSDCMEHQRVRCSFISTGSRRLSRLAMTTVDELRLRYQHREVAARYDSDRFGSLWGRFYAHCEERALLQAVRSATSELRAPLLLDVACGTGRITEALLRCGWAVTASDISDSMLEVARRRCRRQTGHVTFVREDMFCLSHAAASFDVVTCLKVLHHFGAADRMRLLRSLARVARQSVIVSVSFSSPLYAARRRMKRLLGGRSPKHSSTWADIHREASEAGLVLRRAVWTCPLVSESLVLLFDRCMTTN